MKETRRWSHVTYASFGNRSGGGGWHTGPTANADQTDEQLVTEYAPTQMVPTRPFDDFIGAAEIAELPRRFEYLPLGDKGLFMQSVPAGKDATGRPGNVFTHAVIDHDLSQPLKAAYPINLFRSPDLITPFRIGSVNAVKLSPDLQEPRPGPLADLSVAWMMVRTMLGDRTGALYRLQDVLSEGTTLPVLTVKNANEAVYWLQVLSSTLSPKEARQLLRFSTFERSATLPTQGRGEGRSVVVVPATDKEDLQRREGISIIDPADPNTYAVSPSSTWSTLTKGVFTNGISPLKVVEQLAAEPGVEKSAELSFGDGLAHLVSAQPKVFGSVLIDVAARHLSSTRPAESPSAVASPDVDLIKRVIEQPRLVLKNDAWPMIKPAEMTERAYFQLADNAVESIARLKNQPPKVLVFYLDFLLRTGLVLRENVREQGFREQFNTFPSLRGWRQVAFPAGAHSELLTLLELAGQDQQERDYAVEKRAERALLHLSSANSIDNILLWLGQRETRGKLRTLVDNEVIARSARDYTPDLLRVYYTVVMYAHATPVITGDPELDHHLITELGKLTLQAVEKHAQDGPVSFARFQRLGENIAREDFREISPDPQAQKRAEDNIREHLNPEKIHIAERVVRQVIATVAQGMIAEISRAERSEADA